MLQLISLPNNLVISHVCAFIVEGEKGEKGVSKFRKNITFLLFVSFSSYTISMTSLDFESSSYIMKWRVLSCMHQARRELDYLVS